MCGYIYVHIHIYIEVCMNLNTLTHIHHKKALIGNEGDFVQHLYVYSVCLCFVVLVNYLSKTSKNLAICVKMTVYIFLFTVHMTYCIIFS